MAQNTQSEYVGKTYAEIYKIWSEKFISQKIHPDDLKRIHVKWKEIAAQCK